MAKALMIQGTGSGVGKSLFVAGLCRIFRDKGVNVAPFKAQNMALNSFITREGGEIGRAQAFQAEAARVEPSVDMNPILLKATGEAGCQVILNGRVHGSMQAQEYYSFKNEAWAAVTAGYELLSKQHDLIIMEGAGSPAEINLSDAEVVNMRMARHANAPVLLVGDIDKGGVFASLYGTIALLDGDAALIKAFIINKFRGDLAILEPGLRMISEKTGRPVLGVIPYLGDMGLHEEDGIPQDRLQYLNAARPVRIVVLRLRYISNFTDFDPFLYEQDVDIVYSLRSSDIENADMVIIPGSKNTVLDLLYLRESGIEASIKRAADKGIPIAGICGGYQMLGKKLFDPERVESPHQETNGMGLLDVETVFDRVKTTCQVKAQAQHRAESIGLSVKSDETALEGYEIHMGRTTGEVNLFSLKRTSLNSAFRTPHSALILDGSSKGSVWGTYLHGIFDNDGFRREVINSLRQRRGLQPLDERMNYSKARDESLDRWADILRENLDMKFIEELVSP
ncbi:MAG: cobyric acid synthase CobQ [Nitrospirae bacterium GWC1_57_7]|nr:MAG: cobyric acid synthase CobQ [Nitrospirae bacterium GWC1_57_7]